MTTKALLTLILPLCFLPAAAALEVTDLRCEFRKAPLPIDVAQPRLGWRIVDSRRGVIQQAYQVQVAPAPDRFDDAEQRLWDSGRVASRQSQLVVYQGEPLESRDECYWRVRVWDQDGQASGWSAPAKWTIALLRKEDWKADWIGYDTRPFEKNPELDLPPSPILRKSFKTEKPIQKATLYATALGIYELSLNGKRVGDQHLTPGWTDYHSRLPYQTYDVTAQLAPGENALGATLSPGWYSGYIGYALSERLPQHKDFYGEVPTLLCQLEIEYADGSKQRIVSDTSWKANVGPVLESDILMGVTYDARKVHAGWNEPGFDESDWRPVEPMTPEHGPLQAQSHEPVRVTGEIDAKRILKSPERGGYIIDFGQNFAGVVRLRVIGKPGQKITLRFGEMLHPDGRIMTENLRGARATDTYICRGDEGGEIWTPSFTYHGFQFVEIVGLDAMPSLDTLTGVVLESDTEPAGLFACSSPLLNKLYQNIVWTQRANFVELPTDCPQRDERLGWTGDAQIYVRSAAWNRHVPSFFTKWARDCRDAQWPSGAFTNFAPRPFSREKKMYSPAYMEGGIICPWTMHQVYGDRRILEENYESMKRFVEFHVEKAGPAYVYKPGSWNELDPEGGWGDWLALGVQTPKEIIATFYYGLSLRLMSEIAEATGHEGDARLYSDHYDKFLTAMRAAYLKEDGTMEGDTQTVYALAIAMGLLTPEQQEAAGERLLQLLDESDGKMQTGFIGTKHLPSALTIIGRSDLTYDLLNSTQYPGWGYEVVNGATTIWERWDSYTRDKGFGEYNVGMNSFCHYSFGSICHWMFEHMAGIQSPGPGFQKIVFQPELTPLSNISWAEAAYDSFYGPVRSRWEITGIGESASLSFTVPPNTTATAIIPTSDADAVQEGGRPLAEVAEVQIEKSQPARLTVSFGSGEYNFQTALPQPTLQGVAD